MPALSIASFVLSQWGANVNELPTSHKEESDLLAELEGCRFLIEEKTKVDDPAYVRQRQQALASEGFMPVLGVIFLRHAANRFAMACYFFTASCPPKPGLYKPFMKSPMPLSTHPPLLQQVQLALLGGAVTHRRIKGHIEGESVRVLGRAQGSRVLARDFLGECDSLGFKLSKRY